MRDQHRRVLLEHRRDRAERDVLLHEVSASKAFDVMLKSSRPASSSCVWFTCGPPCSDRHVEAVLARRCRSRRPGRSRRIPPRPSSRVRSATLSCARRIAGDAKQRQQPATEHRRPKRHPWYPFGRNRRDRPHTAPWRRDGCATSFGLAGRRAIVTGHRGGIGAAIAATLEADGAEVIGLDLPDFDLSDIATLEARAAALVAARGPDRHPGEQRGRNRARQRAGNPAGRSRAQCSGSISSPPTR